MTLDPFPILHPLLTRIDRARAHQHAHLGVMSRLATFFYSAPVEVPILHQADWNRFFSAPTGLGAR
jgi:hypothetical protein